MWVNQVRPPLRGARNGGWVRARKGKTNARPAVAKDPRDVSSLSASCVANCLVKFAQRDDGAMRIGMDERRDAFRLTGCARSFDALALAVSLGGDFCCREPGFPVPLPCERPATTEGKSSHRSRLLDSREGRGCSGERIRLRALRFAAEPSRRAWGMSALRVAPGVGRRGGRRTIRRGGQRGRATTLRTF